MTFFLFISQRISYFPDARMEWGTDDGHPPKDSPDCGFENEFCLETAKSKLINALLILLFGLK